MSNKIDKKTFFEAIQKSLDPYEFSPLLVEFIKFTLKNRYEGAILVDSQGRIVFMDKPCEKFFGLSRGAAKDRHVNEFVPDTSLQEVARSGVPEVGKIQDVKGHKKIVSRLPIIKDGRTLIPLRFVSESLGAFVDWDNESRTAIIVEN